MIRHAGLRRSLRADRGKLAPAQGVETIAREYEALSLSAREAFANEILCAIIHGRQHLTPEAAIRKGRGSTRKQLAVEPGRAVSADPALRGLSPIAPREQAVGAPRASSYRRTSTIEPGSESPVESRSASRTWWTRPSTPSMTAKAEPLSSWSSPRATRRRPQHEKNAVEHLTIIGPRPAVLLAFSSRQHHLLIPQRDFLRLKLDLRFEWRRQGDQDKP